MVIAPEFTGYSKGGKSDNKGKGGKGKQNEGKGKSGIPFS